MSHWFIDNEARNVICRDLERVELPDEGYARRVAHALNATALEERSAQLGAALRREQQQHERISGLIVEVDEARDGEPEKLQQSYALGRRDAKREAMKIIDRFRLEHSGQLMTVQSILIAMVEAIEREA